MTNDDPTCWLLVSKITCLLQEEKAYKIFLVSLFLPLVTKKWLHVYHRINWNLSMIVLIYWILWITRLIIIAASIDWNIYSHKQGNELSKMFNLIVYFQQVNQTNQLYFIWTKKNRLISTILLYLAVQTACSYISNFNHLISYFISKQNKKIFNVNYLTNFCKFCWFRRTFSCKYLHEKIVSVPGLLHYSLLHPKQLHQMKAKQPFSAWRKQKTLRTKLEVSI